MAALLSLAAAAGVLAACDALIGLNTFHVCPDDCGVAGSGMDASDASDSSTVPAPDTGTEASDDASEGGDDGGDGGDGGDALDAPLEADADGSGQGWPDVAQATVTEIWVHWPMPNPDAAIAPGLDAALPNPMHYSVGDAGDPVLDLVTNLQWEPVAWSATTYLDAEEHCLSLGSGWRVPTRIELVSLIDFTQSPTIDGVFGFPAGTTFDAGTLASWTSSMKTPDAAPTALHWTVSFADGTVASGVSGQWIRCVLGGS
jgi:hypothetical protein